MAKVDVTMQGLEAVISKIGNSTELLHNTVLQKAREKSEKMVGIQKENCPVDTSILRESIHAFVEDNGDVISAGSKTNVSYAAYVEFGRARQVMQTVIRLIPSWELFAKQSGQGREHSRLCIRE